MVIWIGQHQKCLLTSPDLSRCDYFIRSHEDVSVPEKFKQMNFFITFLLHATWW